MNEVLHVFIKLHWQCYAGKTVQHMSGLHYVWLFSCLLIRFAHKCKQTMNVSGKFFMAQRRARQKGHRNTTPMNFRIYSQCSWFCSCFMLIDGKQFKEYFEKFWYFLRPFLIFISYEHDKVIQVLPKLIHHACVCWTAFTMLMRREMGL